ncbi:MAG: hypothetical protein ACKOX3_12630 [Bacteroidota bacterium]
MLKGLNKSITFALVLIGTFIGSNAFAQVEDSTASLTPRIDLEPEDTTIQTLNKLYNDVEFLKRFQLSGYVQTQFQWADSAGIASAAGGNFNTGVDKRFSVRRGRLKVTYDKYFSKVVFQTDMTERGLRVVEAYASFTEQKYYWATLTTGIFNRPFGYEIEYTSNMREAPERGRMSGNLFPNERDLGAKLTLQGPKTGIWNWLKLDVALVTGEGSPDANTGISDFDKRKDLISHLSVNRANRNEDLKYGFGVSYYNGGVIYNVDSIKNVATYILKDDSAGVKTFHVDSVAPSSYAPRTYYGIDGQLQKDFKWGIFTLKAEYIQGTHSSQGSTSKAYQSKPTVTNPIYTRKFNGAYFELAQNLNRLSSERKFINTLYSLIPGQIVLKYDWYDPNTDVKGDEIGKNVTVGATGRKATNATDLRYDTFGFGVAYFLSNNAKILAYYDTVKNETSKNLSGYTKDLKDNVFTLRFQYKF